MDLDWRRYQNQFNKLVEAVALPNSNKEEASSIVLEALSEQAEQHQRILALRFGLQDGTIWIRKEIARRWRLREYYIERIEHKALKTLQKRVRTRQLLAMPPDERQEMAIDVVDFSTRTSNLLRAMRIATWADLIRRKDEVLQARMCGPKTHQEIEDWIVRLGMR